jgi:TIR domain
MIGAGEEWKGQIDRQLAEADIILLLVSADFIASDYCWGEEMTKALARHQLGEARVIPVILRPCRRQKTPLGSLQAGQETGSRSASGRTTM